MTQSSLPPHMQKEVAQIVEDLPEEKRVAVTRLFRQITRVHSGPLPDPDSLERYARAIPNGGDRIMTLVEKQTEYRHQQQAARLRMMQNGQWIGTGLTVFLTLAAVYLGVTGSTLPAAILFTTTILGVGVIFALGRRDLNNYFSSRRGSDRDLGT